MFRNALHMSYLFTLCSSILMICVLVSVREYQIGILLSSAPSVCDEKQKGSTPAEGKQTYFTARTCEISV